MAIQSISRAEFDTFNPARSAMIVAITEEVEWFADDARNLIGTVVRDKTDDDWSFVVLGRDEHGTFRAVRAATCITDREVAKAKLISEMGEFEASGQTVFPQSG